MFAGDVNWVDVPQWAREGFKNFCWQSCVDSPAFRIFNLTLRRESTYQYGKKREWWWDQAKQQIAMGHEYEERYTLHNEEVGILLHMHPLSLGKIKRHKTIPTYPKLLFAKECLEWRHWRVSQISLQTFRTKVSPPSSIDYLPPLATWNSNPMPWTERWRRSSLQCSVPGSYFDMARDP